MSSMSPTVENQGGNMDKEQSENAEIIPDTPRQGNANRILSGRNIFAYMLEIQKAVDAINKKIDLQKNFRVEGEVRVKLSTVAKSAFGVDIFDISGVSLMN